MAQYINKSALVAEIKEYIDNYNKGYSDGDNYKADALKTLLQDIDFFFEVKEVDLEKYYHDFLQKEWFDKDCNRPISEMMAFTAKHFYELGLKTRKED